MQRKTMTDAELEQAMVDTESDRTERKESQPPVTVYAKPFAHLRTICPTIVNPASFSSACATMAPAQIYKSPIGYFEHSRICDLTATSSPFLR